MDLLAERFDEWLGAINYSPKTRVNYLRDVKGFISWLADNTSIASIVEVTPAELQQYQMAIYNYERVAQTSVCGEGEKKRLAVGTQACRLAAVRKFFSWLAAEQQIAYNPASALQPPKQPPALAHQHPDPQRSKATDRINTNYQASRHSRPGHSRSALLDRHPPR
jgi:site-specific recombinase XerD